MRLTYSQRKQLNDTLKLIGHNIHKIRIRKNFSLKKISARTGFNIETIDKYEMGKTVIQLPELLKISTALETPLEKLIENKS